MHSRSLLLVSMTVLSVMTACKPSNEAGADLSAEAAKVAAGEEVLLTGNSVPPPVVSPKIREGDLDPKNFSLQPAFTRDRVAEFQLPGSDLTATPRDLQGIWWMDGNPLPDETISFGKIDFTQEKPLLAVFGDNNFSYHAGSGSSDFPQGDSDFKAGQFLFRAAQAAGLVYEFNWTGSGADKYNSARIIPTFRVKIGPIERWLRLSPKIMEFTMVKKGENLYSRDNTLFGKPIDGYDFRRVLVPSASDPKVLEKTEFWDAYAKQSSPATMRLPVRN